MGAIDGDSNQVIGEPSREPEISFGFRGEDLNYRRGERALQAGFTWVNGPRLYPDTIRAWRDGTALGAEEQAMVFRDLLAFLVRGGELPIVVIDRDGASRFVWERVAREKPALVSAIEYTPGGGRGPEEGELRPSP